MGKPVVLQLNVTANWGSTGKIAEQINLVAQRQGWETFIAYGRNCISSQSKLIRVGSMLQVYEHYAEYRLFDNDGLASRKATKQFVKILGEINPDIIHVHNIHDHWINYRILFEALNALDKPIIWTLHDCWAFTGGCPHFVTMQCQRWKDETCGEGCPLKQQALCRRFFEKTRKHFELKRSLFVANENLTVVPVSYWLEGFVRQSFLKDKKIQTIHNGIDLGLFTPSPNDLILEKHGLLQGKYVIGVSNVWDDSKGLNDFIALRRLLPPEIMIVLVGNKRGRSGIIPSGVADIPYTESVAELAALYSSALVFINLTYQDNYPTTNLEAMACGTPVLTYQTGGSPEAVTPETGWVVEQGDIADVARIVECLWKCDSDSLTAQREVCRMRAIQEFDKDKCFAEYMELYGKALRSSTK